LAGDSQRRNVGYEFECNNVIPGCEGKVTADSKDAVLEAAADHAKEVHAMDDLSDDVVDKVRLSIVPVP
jgi:predicted small metal-binding protein